MRRWPARRPTVLAALLLVASCRTREDTRGPGALPQQPAAFDLAAACADIERANVAFTRAHVAGDVAAIDAMFTRDATSLPPGAEAAVGPAALHTLTVEYLASGIKDFREETTDCYGNGDLLVDHGTYSVTYGPASTVERGKYMNVWKQEDGRWKIHANIWNTSPAGAPAR